MIDFAKNLKESVIEVRPGRRKFPSRSAMVEYAPKKISDDPYGHDLVKEWNLTFRFQARVSYDQVPIEEAKQAAKFLNRQVYGDVLLRLQEIEELMYEDNTLDTEAGQKVQKLMDDLQ